MQETPNHRGSSTTIVVTAGVLLLIALAIATPIYLPYRQKQKVDQVVRARGGFIAAWDYYGPTLIPESQRHRFTVWDRNINIDLTSTPTTDDDLILLREQFHLVDQELGFTRISDAGLEHLKGLPNLDVLDFDGTAITDDGLKELKGLTKLVGLNLADTAISDSGLEHLKAFKNLKYLKLRRTHITDAGIEHLKALTSLEGIALDGTAITPDKREELQKLLPDPFVK
jgi:hypothetical protein